LNKDVLLPGLAILHLSSVLFRAIFIPGFYTISPFLIEKTDFVRLKKLQKAQGKSCDK